MSSIEMKKMAVKALVRRCYKGEQEKHFLLTPTFFWYTKRLCFAAIWQADFANIGAAFRRDFPIVAKCFPAIEGYRVKNADTTGFYNQELSVVKSSIIVRDMSIYIVEEYKTERQKARNARINRRSYVCW